MVSLDRLPSSQVEDPILVHCPPPRRRRSHAGHAARVTCAFVALILLILGALVGTIESGAFDRPLSLKAQAALDNAIGPAYTAEVGSTVIRFTKGLRLALVARDVKMVENASGKHVSSAERVRLVLDPLALIEGRIVIADVDAKGLAVDTALLPAGDPIDPAKLRVDRIPVGIEAIFANLDFLRHMVMRGGTESMQLSGLEMKIARQDGRPPLSVVVDSLDFSQPDDETLQLKGQISIEGAPATLDVTAVQAGGRPQSLTAVIRHLDLNPPTMAYTPEGQPRQGIDSFADVTIAADRGGADVDATFKAAIMVQPGSLYMDREEQPLSGATISLAYNPAHKTMEIMPSEAHFQATTVPFSGAVIDLDRLDPQAEQGFGIDFLIKGGTAAPMGSGEAPLSFDGQAKGRYVTATREFQFDTVGVSSPLGTLFGSLRVKLGGASPEVSFGGRAETLQTAAIKQLWPFWMSSKARNWALGNLFGGTVTNATISVFIPQGRLAEAAATGALHLQENELHIAFDIAETRMNVPGEIPPIRDLGGHFDLNGPVLTVDVKGGASYFPSGRSVTLGPSTFSIPSTYDKPLMARMKLALSGDADAVGELLTFQPLRVLQRTEFKAEDFSGKVSANVDATLGLINDQNPPRPVWTASLDLQKIDILKPFSGRKITRLDGRIDADPQRVHLTANAQIDGVPATIDMSEPTDPNSGVKRERVITATLSNQQREKLMPGLSDVLDGPVAVELTRLDEDRQAVSIDLGKAAVTVPWIGWSKGSGIAATADFEASGPTDQLAIKNFSLKGDGFGVAGDMMVGRSGLSQANFSSVRLSNADDFSLSLKRGKSGFDISIVGDTADVRPILARLKSTGSGGGGDSGGSFDATIRAKLDKLVGFNDETVGNFNMTYSLSGGRVTTADLSGVTRSGQAVVSELVKGAAGTIHVTSGDAGAVARFADIYRNMKGGLLNLALRADGDQRWEGSIDIRHFNIVNEKRLQSIVSTPTGRGGQSLNSAVKREIDTSSQTFQRGFAHLVVRDGAIAVENGVVRGEQVGATFQGMLKDAAGRIDLTGTFMPAYGLNRLFAEVPIVGFLLGNGQDRGLIGITFKLTGDFSSPNLAINPLSIIAPGVFRQIFEFQ